jgi:indole-3-glycerol phosphate synthase
MRISINEIAARTRLRVDAAKETTPLEAVREKALEAAASEGSPKGPPEDLSSGGGDFPFEKALAAPGLSFICEVKKASPSKGLIAADFPYLRIAGDYEDAGAAAISVLTEPDFFLGSNAYLREIAAAVIVPVLRKDFIVDPYQIYEAKLLGASAVLLICALLDDKTLSEYKALAESLGLSALVEAHDEAEAAMAIRSGARIIGINNRDLKTFQVDLAVTSRLREKIPPGVIVVSESGIGGPDDIRALGARGIDAVLVGETLMRASDRKAYLRTLREASRDSLNEN